MSYKSLENIIHDVVSNSVLDESIKHDRYVRAHGKKASGRGMWAFTTKAAGEPKDREMTIVTGSKTLSDAAREAMKILNTNSVYVMEHVELAEKSMSQAQQKAAGAALAAKRGEVEPSELVGASKEMYDSMSTKELEDFASTKHKGLPKKVAESVMTENEDEMPASPDEKRMAMKQAEFLMYVGREVSEHLAANKEFPEWMQNKLSALHQKAKDVHASLGDHGGDEMDEAYGREAAQKNYERITKAKTGETVQQRQDWYKKNAEAARKRMQQTNEARGGTDEPDRHIVMQLRKAQDVGGDHPIRFRGGKTAKVAKKHIDKILKVHDHPSIKPVQKRQMRVAISKSPEHLARFADRLKEDYNKHNVDSILNEAQYKVPSNYAAMMQRKKKRDISQQMADKAKRDNISQSDKDKLAKLHSMMKNANEVKEVKSAPKGYHFTRSGQLKKGDADRDGPGGPMLRSDPLDKQRKKIPPLPEETNEAVGTAAKYAGKTGFMGGKYTHHDRAMDLTRDKLAKYRDKQQAKRDAAHKAQDPSMAKRGYAQNVVDRDKAQKKAAEKGLGRQNISYAQGNSMRRGKLPEEIDDNGREVIHTRKSDFKLSKVRLPDGRIVYRKVRKEIDIGK